MMPVPLRIFWAGLFIILSSLLGAQSLVVETWSYPLVGSLSAPQASGEGEPVLVEAFDSSGLLLSVGRLPLPAGGAGAVDGSSPAGVAGKSGKAKDGAELALPKAAEARAATPTKPSPYDGLSFLDLRYDRAGHIVELSERQGQEAAAAKTLRSYDEEGRLFRVERFEKGELVESLEIAYEGSGEVAHLALRDVAGELGSTATLRFGRGGISDLSTELEVRGADGAEAGGLSLSWNSAGRLVRWAARPAAKSATDKAPAPSSATDRSAAKPAAGSALDKASVSRAKTAGIMELLFPVFPADADGFEVFARLAGGKAETDFRALRASSFETMPLSRPSEGWLDYLWDDSGRLIEVGLRSPSGEAAGGASFRYDDRGLLVETTTTGLSAKKDGGLESTETSIEALVSTYSLDRSGGWVSKSKFLRRDTPELAGLAPLEYRERRVRRGGARP